VIGSNCIITLCERSERESGGGGGVWETQKQTHNTQIVDRPKTEKPDSIIMIKGLASSIYKPFAFFHDF